MKPICFKCRMFYRPRQTGFYFTEGMPIDPKTRPGVSEPDKWKPYKIWSGDLWECRGCGSVIISGCGLQPVAIQHEEKFAHNMMVLNAGQFQVNDC